jgi:hypothetical protein
VIPFISLTPYVTAVPPVQLSVWDFETVDLQDEGRSTHDLLQIEQGLINGGHRLPAMMFDRMELGK